MRSSDRQQTTCDKTVLCTAPSLAHCDSDQGIPYRACSAIVWIVTGTVNRVLLPTTNWLIEFVANFRFTFWRVVLVCLPPAALIGARHMGYIYF